MIQGLKTNKQRIGKECHVFLHKKLCWFLQPKHCLGILFLEIRMDIKRTNTLFKDISAEIFHFVHCINQRPSRVRNKDLIQLCTPIVDAFTYKYVM